MNELRAALLGATSLLACTKANPAVCCTSAADCSSIGVSDDARTCSVGLVCMDHACTVPPDGPTAQCTVDKDCPAASPHCDGQFVCVECTMSPQCPASSPVCDTEHCRGCLLDAECDSGICDIPTGTCVDEAKVAYASPTGSTIATCEKADPCSIGRAFTLSDASRPNVLLAPGAYQANVVIENKSVIVRATGATITSTSGFTFEVDDRGSLQLIGGSVVASGSIATAIQCTTTNNVDTPHLAISDANIESTGRGINLIQCVAALTGVHVHSTDSPLGGVQASMVDANRCAFVGPAILGADAGTNLRFKNSMFDLDDATNGALISVNDAAVFVSFSTVVGAKITCLNGTPDCTGSAPVGVCIDDSIVANLSAGAPTNFVTGGLCSVSSSIVYPQTASLGAGNKLGVDPKLKDPANGDYHLVAGSPAIDASAPGASDSVDYDGKARDAKPDLGAFEF